MRGWWSAWEDLNITVEEYRELDNERVLVLAGASGRGKMSGVDVVTTGAALYHVHAGKVTRIVIYWDRERALADLELAHEGDTA